MRRLLGAVLVATGLAGAGFFGWCLHRISPEVVTADPAFPRPLPYPDRTLHDWWQAREEAMKPVFGGFACAPHYDLEARLRAAAVSAIAVIAAGIALVLWPQRDRTDRLASILRGFALGLLGGAVWVSILGLAARGADASVWLWLAAYASAFGSTGAIIGAVRSYPECVGCLASLFASAGFWLATEPNGLSIYLEREKIFFAAVSGLIWGPAIGFLYRRHSPRSHRSRGVRT